MHLQVPEEPEEVTRYCKVGRRARASDLLVSSKCSSAEEMFWKVGQDYRGKTDGQLRRKKFSF